MQVIRPNTDRTDALRSNESTGCVWDLNQEYPRVFPEAHNPVLHPMQPQCTKPHALRIICVPFQSSVEIVRVLY